MTAPWWGLAYRDELAARLSAPIADDDLDRATAALEDASALVLHEAGDPAWTADTVPRAVRRVVLVVARRQFVNPDGLLMETETVGSVTTMEQREAGAGGAYLTETERQIVRRYRTGGGGGLWVQPTTRGEYGLRTGFVDDQYGLEPFPLDPGYSRTWP